MRMIILFFANLIENKYFISILFSYSFEVMSDLHRNYTNNVPNTVNELPNIEEIAEILGCKVVSSPIKYISWPFIGS